MPLNPFLSFRGPHTLVEKLTTAPTPLDPPLSLLLPFIVHEAEKGALAPRHLPDPLHRSLLLPTARHRHPVRAPLARPPGLQVVHFFAGTRLRKQLELRGDEFAGPGGGDLSVEEGVDVCRCNVRGGA